MKWLQLNNYHHQELLATYQWAQVYLLEAALRQARFNIIDVILSGSKYDKKAYLFSYHRPTFKIFTS